MYCQLAGGWIMQDQCPHMLGSRQAVGQDDGLSDENLVSTACSVTWCTQGSMHSKTFEVKSWSSLNITPVAFS